MADKKYGLILSEKGNSKSLKFQASHNVFGNDSDSEGEQSKKPVLKPDMVVKRQAKISQEKALIEDPTVYQYDEIYDQMSEEKHKEKTKTKKDNKPKYIENLLKTATKRKIENERRLERQIQKEREKEGDEFKDKEVFVTSAYKKKLEELRIEEEKEKREEYLENIGDVTKQQDLGGFYRHLYEQKLGTDKKIETPNKDNIEIKDNIIENKDNLPQNKKGNDGDNSNKQEDKSKKRNYRKRKSSEGKNLSDGEIEESEGEINRLNINNIQKAKKTKPSEENIDADSDFSIDESSDEDDTQNITKSTAKDASPIETPPPPPSKTPEENKTKHKEVESTKPVVVPEVKPKIDVWKKRTVGEIFDQALKRYYERKSIRGY